MGATNVVEDCYHLGDYKHYTVFMKRRVFVAIELPAKIKVKVEEQLKKFRVLPMRWIPPENWHFTLVPPQYLTEQELEKLQRLLSQTDSGQVFELGFSRIEIVATRERGMIWLSGEAPIGLKELQAKLQSSLGDVKTNGRELKLHVTLARFRNDKKPRTHSKVLRQLAEKITFEVKDLGLIESQLLPEGARYTRLKTFPLKGR